MSPDVILYIQKVKQFLDRDEIARKYFLEGADEELFYKHLIEIAQKNYEKDGEPTLTQQQFELLRRTIKAITISNSDAKDMDNQIYLTINGFGKICLN